MTDPDSDATEESLIETYDGPTEIPPEHPLAVADDPPQSHAEHVRALGEYLRRVDPDDVHCLMLIQTANDGTDTVPTLHPDADVENAAWYQLAAHISHLARTFGVPPEKVAKHGCHVLRDQQYAAEDGETDA
jgi:hypothetical protein